MWPVISGLIAFGVNWVRAISGPWSWGWILRRLAYGLASVFILVVGEMVAKWVIGSVRAVSCRRCGNFEFCPRTETMVCPECSNPDPPA